VHCSSREKVHSDPPPNTAERSLAHWNDFLGSSGSQNGLVVYSYSLCGGIVIQCGVGALCDRHRVQLSNEREVVWASRRLSQNSKTERLHHVGLTRALALRDPRAHGGTLQQVLSRGCNGFVACLGRATLLCYTSKSYELPPERSPAFSDDHREKVGLAIASARSITVHAKRERERERER